MSLALPQWTLDQGYVWLVLGERLPAIVVRVQLAQTPVQGAEYSKLCWHLGKGIGDYLLQLADWAFQVLAGQCIYACFHALSFNRMPLD